MGVNESRKDVRSIVRHFTLYDGTDSSIIYKDLSSVNTSGFEVYDMSV